MQAKPVSTGFYFAKMSYENAKRILVCGGRDYADAVHVAHVLSYTESFYGPFVLIQGGARGADRIAKDWAAQHGAPCVEVSAQWEFYGKRAGSERNRWMLEILRPDVCIAFPGGAGTAHMVRIATNAGVEVHCV